MFNKVIREKYYCALDVGSQRIKIGIFQIKDSQSIELLGVFEQPTHGLQNGAVNDLGELTECIQHGMQVLLKRTEAKIKEVQLGVGGEFIDTRQTKTVIPLMDKGNKVIAHRDVKKVNNQARLLGINVEEEIVHDFPQNYQIDDSSSALNPLGLYGRKLGVQSLLIVINGNRIRNITKAINQAGYDVGNICFTSYVASDVTLSTQEKEEGCILVDIGSQVTNVLVFKDNVLKGLTKIQLGGDHFTQAIAHQLNLSFDLAEEIKKSYAMASSSEQYHDEEILVKRESNYIPIKRGDIVQAIEPQVETLINNIKSGIEESGTFIQINRGIVVIGGGALLPGLIERIGGALNFSVRLGKFNISMKKKLSNSAIFSSVVGLAQCRFRQSFGYSVSSNGHAHWAKMFTNKFLELYQEYF